MAAYLVTYDLRKEISSEGYTELITQIKTYGGWAKVLKSTWVVISDKSASEIRDHLAKYIDADDGLFVLKSGKAAAWQKVNCTSAWLKDNL